MGASFKTNIIAGVGFGIGLVAVILIADYVGDWFKRGKTFSDKAEVAVKEHRVTRSPYNASVIGRSPT